MTPLGFWLRMALCAALVVVLQVAFPWWPGVVICAAILGLAVLGYYTKPKEKTRHGK